MSVDQENTACESDQRLVSNNGIRTRYPLISNQMLYLVSYVCKLMPVGHAESALLASLPGGRIVSVLSVHG